jgi:cobalt-zinc-cadmium efflux system outer membrane protein
MGADEINAIVDVLPAVRSAKAEAQAAKLAVDQAEANKRPDPTIGIRAGEEGDDSLIGASFSIPLFVRNNFDDDVMAAVSARSRSEAEYEHVATLSRANLTAALLQFSKMREAWDEWQSVSSVSMETQSKVLTRLWEARELNMSEFLLQYRQNLETKNTAVELRQTLWRAWINVLQQSNQAERWLATGAVTNAADDFRGINDDK